jgi:hypothetical protein
MNQTTADLFELPAIARRRDPETSHVAAEKCTRTTRQSDCDLLHDLVMQHPGCTAGEYSKLLIDCGMPAQKAARMPTKRLSDLCKAERLIIGKPRRCDVTGHTARTYYARPD